MCLSSMLQIQVHLKNIILGCHSLSASHMPGSVLAFLFVVEFNLHRTTKSKHCSYYFHLTGNETEAPRD